jgi:hypothetical protein
MGSGVNKGSPWIRLKNFKRLLSNGKIPELFSGSGFLKASE